MKKYVLVIHGGAGSILKTNMTSEKETAYLALLTKALAAGELILKKAGSAADAVEAAIRVMEDTPLFNAGRGAVFANDETIAHDASIMEGAKKAAGAVTGSTILRNPISAARLVMEQSSHVLLSGQGADEFGTQHGAEIVDPAYFKEEVRFRQLKKVQQEEGAVLDHDSDLGIKAVESSSIEFNYDGPIDLKKELGTVGAVALDHNGCLVAGTSTGGMTNKRYGRVGDSPLIGAGTYADNNTCAVSCTGHGEYFMRWCVAYDLAARMEYLSEDLIGAGNFIIHEKLAVAGGKGGLIAVDALGNYTMPFNTPGMYRGVATSDGVHEVAMYKD